jgi:hypothetical protein
MAVTGPAGAQTRTDAGSWQLSLQVPAATETALRSGDGIPWDQLRRNGLDMSARGDGEVWLVLFSLTLENGRVIESRTSQRFAAAAGSERVSGRYLPSLEKLRVTRVEAGRLVPVDGLIEMSKRAGDADNAGNAGNAGLTLPTALVRGRALVMFVAPPGGGLESSSSPLFVRTDRVSD